MYRAILKGENGMLLQYKVAVIYEAGGGVGSAVARAFAHEGAELFLTGRKALGGGWQSLPTP
jgi:hypothetical protein